MLLTLLLAACEAECPLDTNVWGAPYACDEDEDCVAVPFDGCLPCRAVYVAANRRHEAAAKGQMRACGEHPELGECQTLIGCTEPPPPVCLEGSCFFGFDERTWER